MELLFANVTHWSHLCKHFLSEQVTKVDVVLIAEHHLRGSDVTKAKREVSQMRWRPHFQDALESPGGGTHAGVAAVVQPGLYCKKFLAQCGKHVQIGSGNGWFFLEMKLKDATLAVGVCYLVCSLGIAG